MPNLIEIDGHTFRDLDHDGQLAPYEDWRLPDATRADDLLKRMTLEEKVGLLLHGTLVASGSPLVMIGVGDGYDLDAARQLINHRGVNCMISRLALPPRELAAQNNALQQVAAESRFGIPVTVSTDPRHHHGPMLGASVASAGFSQWPGTLGFAALRSEEQVKRFGDVVRHEYRSVGLHMALSPQADLATSPRWARIDGTFGEDPALVRKLVGAFIEGVQGGRSGPHSHGVAAIVKHWVGYGASKEGFDGHNYYGRHSTFPGGAFDVHVETFLDAFENQVAGVMPTYNILRGLKLAGSQVEQVGAGFCAEILRELRNRGFAGLILSDWAIARDLNDASRFGIPPMGPADIGMPWGVEDLSVSERFAKGINAGLDQFGGEDNPARPLEAIRTGLVRESRVDEAARRVLLQKFALGLFEDPFVDEDEAAAEVGTRALLEEGLAAQQRSIVILKPPRLARRPTIFLQGLDPEPFTRLGHTIVDSVDAAEVAVMKLESPSEELHPGHFFGSRQKEGDLDFKEDDPDYRAFCKLAARLPTTAVITMDRPAILTNVADQSDGLLAVFGISDDAIAAVLDEPASAIGRLPYALPRSMAAVQAQSEDLPLDDPNPLFPIGYRAP